MAQSPKSLRSDWLVPAGLILLSVVPAFVGSLRLAEIARGATVTPANARFLSAPIPIVLHIVAVIPYSMVGAFQFVPGFRRRHRAWHRAAGRVLAPLGLLAALSGLWMAHFYPWPPGDGQLLYVIRLIVGGAMLLALARALVSLRQRDYSAHGAWMTRAYALGLGAGTQVFTHLPWIALASGPPGELPRSLMMGAGWLINAAVAEWVIRRRQRLEIPPASRAQLAA